MSTVDRAWVLREFDLFQDLDDAELVRLGTAAPMSTIDAGRTIYSPDRPSEVLFILKRGRIRLYQLGIDGRTMTTAIIGAGEVFGEMAALGQRLDQTYVETLEPCVVCLMSRPDVERLLLSDPRIALRIAEHLGRRVADLERRLGDTVLKTAPQRLCAVLVRLGEQDASVRLTHAQLADLVGVSRETATKVLGDLVDRGAVALRRGRIVVLDIALLGRLAEDGLGVQTGGRRSAAAQP